MVEITKLKDIIYILLSFLGILSAVGTFAFFILKSKFVLRTDMDKFCRERQAACNSMWCSRIDGLDKKIEAQKSDFTRFQLWLVQTITLIADKMEIPVEQMRQ